MSEFRARNWVFTLNNYTGQEEAEIAAWPAKYLVFGREVGEEGTPHLQGFVMFKSLKSLKQMRKLNPRAHYEAAKADKAAADYCKKDGDFFEIGEEPKGQGARTDIQTAYELAKSRGSLKDAAESELSFQALRIFQITRPAFKPPSIRETAIKVEWHYGPSGTGKTYNALSRGAHKLRYIGQFFTNYDGEKHVVLDDLRPTIPVEILLDLLDNYPCILNVKGGHVWSDWDVITVTTPFSPAEFWSFYPEGEELFQLTRRITEVRNFAETVDHE